MACKDTDRGLADNQWTIGAEKFVTMEQLWVLDQVDGVDYDVYAVTGEEHCTEFEKWLWFELVNSMWMKHRYVFQDHVKYIHNYIVKKFRIGILQYA